MGLGIIMGAIGGAGDAGQQIAQQNDKLWDMQALAQQQSDLDVQKQASLLNLENQYAVGMLYQKNAAEDANRQDQAQRIQSGMVPALRQATIQNAVADPVHDWVPDDAQLNPDGTAVAGTPTVTPTIDDLSPTDLVQFAPTADQQTAAYLASAKNSGDIGPASIAASIAQQAQAKYAADAQVNAQNFQARQQLLAQDFQSRMLADSAKRASSLPAVPSGFQHIGYANNVPVYEAPNGKKYIQQQ